MTRRFTVNRAFGGRSAEVIVSDDGTFTLAGAGPYHIEHAPVSRADYGHNWKAAAKGMWDMGWFGRVILSL